MRRTRGQRGFTLLEATVAMAMMAVSLVGLYYVNYGAMQNHAYSKQLTVASLLARSKMTDLEQKLYDDGLGTDDEEEDGDFSDEGWPSFKWRAKIIAPKTEGLPPEQLLAAVFNIPMGAGGDGADGSTDPLSAMASMFMGAGGDAAGGAGGAAGMMGMLGPMAGLMQGQFQQLVDQITKSVREIHLTVYWKDGRQVESFDVVTHLVSFGPGSDRNGGAGLGSSQAAANQARAGSQWVDSVTGAPVPNPIPAPNGGGMLNPATRNPVIAAGAAGQPGAPGITGGAMGGRTGGQFPGRPGGAVNPLNGNSRNFGGNTVIR